MQHASNDVSPPPGADLVGRAVRDITAHIREHRLGPGDRLPSEGALCDSLGVSRTVVREAFRSLSALRLLDLSVGKRATVARLDDGAMALMMEHGVQTEQIGIQHVYDARRTIEVRTAALAALRRSDEEAAGIVAHAEAMRRHFDDTTLGMEHDLALHVAIARASRNPVFALIIGAFTGVTRQTWPVGWRSRHSDDERMAMVELHHALALAIADGDPQQAGALMARHFDDSSRALTAAGLV